MIGNTMISSVIAVPVATRAALASFEIVRVTWLAALIQALMLGLAVPPKTIGKAARGETTTTPLPTTAPATVIAAGVKPASDATAWSPFAQE